MITKDKSQDNLSWQEIAELTHATQVERFGWCSCEENELTDLDPYDDCPKIGAEEVTGEQTVFCVLCREREAEFELDTERGFDLVCLSCSEIELGGGS